MSNQKIIDKMRENILNGGFCTLPRKMRTVEHFSRGKRSVTKSRSNEDKIERQQSEAKTCPNEAIIQDRTKNFIRANANYCDIQKDCKLLALVKSQYDKVVEQNQSLQRNLLWYKEQAEKDNQYLIKLEEANMLLEQDVETLKQQIEALKERYKENEN